jgi:hypothetical protein
MAVRRSSTTLLPGQTIVAMLLVVLTLAPSIMGRAGFQLIEDAVAARIFPLHRHGVPGEDAYIRTFGQPAPFVHPHCHRAPANPDEHTPAELAVAGMVTGPALCGSTDTAPLTPSASLIVGEPHGVRPAGHSLRPPLLPPQA